MILESESLVVSRHLTLQSEPVSITRPFLKVAPYIFGETNTSIFFSLYSYARIIDDEVDSGLNPQKMKHVLRSDMNVLQRIEIGEDVDLLTPINESDNTFLKEFINRRTLLHVGLLDIPLKKRGHIAHLIYQSLQGAYLDNISISTGHPLFDHLRLARDNRMVIVYFEALSEIFFNKPFVDAFHQHDVETFFQWILRFDALDDIIPDLEVGICVFSRESLKNSGVTLVRGQVVGPKIQNFYRTQRDLLVSESKDTLPLIYKSNLPFIAKTALYARLLWQAHRIGKTEYPANRQVVFGGTRFLLDKPLGDTLYF